ncbi:MAG: ATP synthase protein I [Psychromonas sp.]|jgi:ATP synthase protein I
MTASLTKQGRQLAGKVIFYQSMIGLILSAFFTVFLGINSGISAVYGSITCLVPSFIFSKLAFKYAGASQNELVVRSFNKGSKLKIFLTIILFILVYQWANLQAMPLLVCYVITLLAQWPIIIFMGRVNK